MSLLNKKSINEYVTCFSVPDRWCIHSYYSMCPYAPDGSGRILLAGADLDNYFGEIIILSKDGEIIDRFGKNNIISSFYHTGYWQTWSSDANFVYYQGGTVNEPKIIRREILSGNETDIEGDMEGAPPSGEPIISGLLGMLLASGYGYEDGSYHAEASPVPFQNRHEHGLFEYAIQSNRKRLLLSVYDILEKHPYREKIKKMDEDIKSRLGNEEGLTLMTYCVRWDSIGNRFLFYFGNHSVDKSRKEPSVSYVMTADRDLRDIRIAVDKGGHWSWHPDNEHLIGYGPDPDNREAKCIAQVRYDGSDYKRLAHHGSGGHPSINPVNHNMLVTDTYGRIGEVLFIDLCRDTVVKSFTLPRLNGEKTPGGRNPFRIDHHPVFNRDGSKVLANGLPGRNAVLYEIDMTGVVDCDEK